MSGAPLVMTADKFPLTATTKENSGLPWSAILIPFHSLEGKAAENTGTSSTPGDAVARCRSCFAYLSCFSSVNKGAWRCRLCNMDNALPREYVSPAKRAGAGEFRFPLVEFEFPLATVGDGEHKYATSSPTTTPTPNSTTSTTAAATAQGIAHVFLVDLSGTADYVELVKTSILAAIEALPGGAKVGLLVFSNKLGVFDLRSTVPYVKYTMIRPQGECGLLLKELLNLNQFLVDLTTHKEHICTALESLSSHYTDDYTHERHRGFGSALQAFAAYTASGGPQQRWNVRLTCFLSGAPNWGLGQVARVPVDREEGQEAKSSFYREFAGVATTSNIGVDLFILPSVLQPFVDLASMKYLCTLTGGTLLLYQSLSTSTLPQDLFKQLSCPLAFRCLLRIRTSKHFKCSINNTLIVEDAQFENLYRIASCDPRKAFCLDFAFTSASGFDKTYKPNTFLQIAFAYTTLKAQVLPESGVTVMVPIRRLRVLTRKFEVASTWADLYSNVCAEAVLASLVNKLLCDSFERGLTEARLLVEDWLINLVVCYNGVIQRTDSKGKRIRRKAGEYKFEDVDVSFRGIPALQFMPRYVFGLLKHDLLTDNNTVQADTRVYFQTLMSGLGCDYLAKLIYPTLYAFENYDHMAVTPQDAPVMPFLDRTTLAEHKNSVFLLDGFTHISVCATVDSLLVFPPPHKSEIRNIVKVLKQRAPLVSPHCTFVQEGTNDAEQWFFSKLVDTPLSMTEETFVQFQTKIAQEALAILNNE